MVVMVKETSSTHPTSTRAFVVREGKIIDYDHLIFN